MHCWLYCKRTWRGPDNYLDEGADEGSGKVNFYHYHINNLREFNEKNN
jgi:hypothetical protein